MEFNVPFVTELLGGFTSSDIEMLYYMLSDLDISRANAKNKQDKSNILSKVNVFNHKPVGPFYYFILQTADRGQF